MATSAQNSATVYDSAGNAFTVDANGKIVVNGVVDSYTKGVLGLYVSEGTLYQTAPDPSNPSADGWWKYTPGSGWHNWTKVSQAPALSAEDESVAKAAAKVTPSADGTVARVGDAALYDSLNNSFAINAKGKIVINGKIDFRTKNVDHIVIDDGKLYQTAPDPTTNGTSMGWWQYTPGSGWHNWTYTKDAPVFSEPNPDPSNPDNTPPDETPSGGDKPSSDGTTVHKGEGSVYDTALNEFSINSTGKIVINGAVDNNTKGVESLVIDDGHLFQSAPDPSNGGATTGWWQYTPGAGWNNWTKVADPDAGTPPAGGGSSGGGSSGGGSSGGGSSGGGSSGGGSSNNGKFPDHWSRLDNGLNIERSEFGKVSDSELKKLAASGVENIRIFMGPDDAGYIDPGKKMNPETSGYVKNFANFMDRVIDAGMAVVVSPFGGPERGAWQRNPNDQASINEYANWYKEFAGFIKNHYNPKDVFIESQAEPFMNDPAAWWKIEAQFVKAVHSVAPEFTFVSSSNGKDFNEWTYISSLIERTPHDDENVVYNIHQYAPMNFTHQGLAWAGDYFKNLKNVQYTSNDKAQIAKDFAALNEWAQKYDVKITVNEFGATQNALESERAEFFSDVRELADKYDFGWGIFDFNKAFSITRTDSSGDEVVKDIYQKALHWGAYQDHDLIA